MSCVYLYRDVNEFVRHLTKFIDSYIDSSWISQTSYHQLTRDIVIDTKKILKFGDTSYNYNNVSELIDICLYLKRSKYLYLNRDRTEGIVIHVLETQI
jgi:hypothetical protein